MHGVWAFVGMSGLAGNGVLHDIHVYLDIIVIQGNSGSGVTLTRPT